MTSKHPFATCRRRSSPSPHLYYYVVQLCRRISSRQKTAIQKQWLRYTTRRVERELRLRERVVAKSGECLRGAAQSIANNARGFRQLARSKWPCKPPHRSQLSPAPFHPSAYACNTLLVLWARVAGKAISWKHKKKKKKNRIEGKK